MSSGPSSDRQLVASEAAGHEPAVGPAAAYHALKLLRRQAEPEEIAAFERAIGSDCTSLRAEIRGQETISAARSREFWDACAAALGDWRRLAAQAGEDVLAGPYAATILGTRAWNWAPIKVLWDHLGDFVERMYPGSALRVRAGKGRGKGNPDRTLLVKIRWPARPAAGDPREYIVYGFMRGLLRRKDLWERPNHGIAATRLASADARDFYEIYDGNDALAPVERRRYSDRYSVFLARYQAEVSPLKKIFGGAGQRLARAKDRENLYRERWRAVAGKLDAVETQLQRQPLEAKGAGIESNTRAVLAQLRQRHARSPLYWNGISFGTIQLPGAVWNSLTAGAYSADAFFLVGIHLPDLRWEDSPVLLMFQQTFRILAQYSASIDELWHKLGVELKDWMQAGEEIQMALARVDTRNQFTLKTSSWPGVALVKPAERKNYLPFLEADGTLRHEQKVIKISGRFQPGDKLMLFSAPLFEQRAGRPIGEFLGQTVLAAAGEDFEACLRQTESILRASSLKAHGSTPPADVSLGVLEIHPRWNDFNDLVKQGLDERRAGKVDSALVTLERAQRLIPHFPKLHFILAKLHSAKKSYGRVAELLDAYRQYFPEEPQVLFNLAQAYRLDGDALAALRIAKRLRSIDEANAEYFVLEARLALKTGARPTEIAARTRDFALQHGANAEIDKLLEETNRALL